MNVIDHNAQPGCLTHACYNLGQLACRKMMDKLRPRRHIRTCLRQLKQITSDDPYPRFVMKEEPCLFASLFGDIHQRDAEIDPVRIRPSQQMLIDIPRPCPDIQDG